MAIKRGLGRGLDALLGDTNDGVEAIGDDSLQHLALTAIQPGKYQPRIDMSQEPLEELAESIRAQGVVQPIVVRAISDSQYEIIAGERRWRAAKMAELATIPVVVRDVSDRAAIAMALIENIQRENLNPMEEANALHRLREEFSMTHQEAAEAVGRSRASVSNLLRLRNLNEDVKRLLENCDIEMGHARALLALEGETQSEAANLVVEKGMSVREAEQLVRRLQQPEKAKQADVDQAEIADFERQLYSKLGNNVMIKHTRSGKGRVLINYANITDLEALIRRIK
jgi:ParB family chromosome partitioning protein